MASLAEQISKLSNPNPVFHDPEDIEDDTTAKGAKPEGLQDDIITPQSSKLRKKTALLIEDDDKRYAGKKVSRKALVDEGNLGALEEESEESNEEDDESMEQDEDDDEEGEDDESVEEDDDDESDEEEPSSEDQEEVMGNLAAFKQQLQQKSRERTLSASQEESFKFEDDGDYGKYGDDDDDMDEDEDDDDDDEDDSMDDDEGDEDDEDEDAEEDEEEEEEGGLQKFSKSSLNEEVQKGIAAKNQLSLWDTLLECRIKLQKSLVIVNQLPQPNMWNQFVNVGDEEYPQNLKKGQTVLKKLLDNLVSLQTDLYQQNPETKQFAKDGGKDGKEATGDSRKRPIDDDDEEIPSDSDVEEEEEEKTEETVPKKKMKFEEYKPFLAKRHKDFVHYRNSTIQKWYDKTRVSSGKLTKGFSAFEQSALKQIEQILSDKERLIKRTQLKRSSYSILGKPEKAVEEAKDPDDPDNQEEIVSKRDQKDYDPEIFDDDDFYHQMLRELIERKTSDINDPIALSRHWLEIQKLRSKMKKKVDTRASKGRKIRYDVHKKLVNFMAPDESSAWTDEAKDDLFSSLFGNTKGKKET